MKHEEIVAGQSYVGRGRHRRVRRVVTVGDAEACGVPAENRRFMKATFFVRYVMEDGVETYDSLDSFAQWATTLDGGWPKSVGAVTLDVRDAQVCITADTKLDPDDAHALSRLLVDAERDARAALPPRPTLADSGMLPRSRGGPG